MKSTNQGRRSNNNDEFDWLLPFQELYMEIEASFQ